MPLPTDLAPSATGKLAKTPFPHLLVFMADRQLDGSILFEAGDTTEHVVHFTHGAPSKVKTAYESTHLGRVLLELGFIDQVTLDQSLEELAKSKVLHGQLLISLGKIDRAQLSSGLREQVLRRMVRLFEKLEHDTSYAFFAGTNLIDTYGGPELTPVDPLRVLCRGVKTRPDHPHVDPTLARLGTAPLLFHPAAVDLGRFGFSKEELAVIDLLRARPASLPEILSSGLLPERSLKVLVYVLLITRNIDLGKREHPPVAATQEPASQATEEATSSRKPAAIARVRLKSVPFTPGALTSNESSVATEVAKEAPSRPQGSAAAPATGPVTAARPPAPAAPQRSSAPEKPAPPAEQAKPTEVDPKIATWRETIKTRAQTIERENFYVVLGVSESEPLDVLQSAYFALAKQWHPDRLPAELSDVKELAAKCFARMSEAFQTLSDPERRSQYQELLKGNAASSEEQAKVQQVIEAAMDFQKAEVFLKKRDLEQAAVFAKKAYEGDPDQPDYAALMAWTMVLVRDKTGNKDYVEPLRLLTASIDREPRCERAYYYRALLYQRQNRMEQAIRDFRKAVELDPRNIDAAREVRLWDMRGGSKGAPPPEPAPGKHKDKENIRQSQSKIGGGLFGKLFKR